MIIKPIFWSRLLTCSLYAFIIIAMFYVLGCANLKKKSFRTVVSGQGGKAIISDPASGSLFPTFVGGSYYSSVTTIPDKLKFKATTKTYYWWGSIAVEETMETK